MFYIFLIIFAAYSLAPLLQPKPSFSATPTNEHRFKVVTSKLGVEFFASQQFFEESKNPTFKKKVEMSIDREHIDKLYKLCDYGKR